VRVRRLGGGGRRRGGEGSLLRTVLRTHPGLRGRLVDLPHVVELARTAADGAPEAPRLESSPADFFDGVPGRSDVVLLKKVIHDRDDGKAGTILRSCRAALEPGGRLLLVENLIPPGDDPSFGKWLDLLMMVYAGGRERTVEEFDALLTAAGFRIAGVAPTAATVSVVEAVAV
jgi:O-methyltransferase domain